jgi:putative Ca2+/H+ antiporter (TMEM165/GDT1 family)
MSWLEVAATAFVLQLTVLPGEKAQFVIAGLATKYRPVAVVGGAAVAFGGWTAVEIALGRALEGALPGVYLDIFTAALFFIFAVVLARSAPANDDRPAATDGGLVDEERFGLDRFGGFLTAFLAIAVGEFGDKTQAVTIGLAVQFSAASAIWAGEMLAIVPVSVLTATLSSRFARRINVRVVHLASAGLFAFFAVDITLSVVTGGFSVWETVTAGVADAVAALG